MREKFASWDILFVQFLKRDWKKIIVWILGIGLFSGGFVSAFKEIAKDQGAAAFFETLQNPAMIALIGPTPVKSGADYTLGAMYAHEMLLFCGLIAMVVSLLHVISHTRKEEDLGLAEIIRSFQVGRHANTFATILEVLLINILLAIFTALVMISFNEAAITSEGSLLFGASIGLAGLIGAAIAIVMAQIMPSSSSATGSALAVIGLLYIIRASTDVTNISLSMMNPFGWTYLTYPFTENNWLPIIVGCLFSILLVLLAIILESKRDMGAGFLPEREGRARAKKSLLCVTGLFMKLNRGTIISWLVAFVIMGATYGSIYGDMQAFLESNELIKQMFTYSGISIEQSFTAVILMVMITLVAILPVAIINKLFVEENRQHLSQIFVTKVSRGKLYWTNILIAFVTIIVGILLSALSLGVTALLSLDGNSQLILADFVLSSINLFPVVLFFAGLAALTLGWAPHLGRLVYVYLTYSFLLSYFSTVLNLPEGFYKTAIQSWIPQMPMEDFAIKPFVGITIVSLILFIIGYIGYNNRDLREGT